MIIKLKLKLNPYTHAEIDMQHLQKFENADKKDNNELSIKMSTMFLILGGRNVYFVYSNRICWGIAKYITLN